MILVDTSVWIQYFNGITNDKTDILDSTLADDIVLMGDLILLEILQGFRNDRDYREAKNMLSALDQHSMLDYSMSIKCADNYRALRKKGITIRKTADVIIATFCIENNFPLLFSDRDFLPFVEHFNLAAI